ncbi:type IV toxin-antitoxin system AbiEi family antitoxin domain-containing protein [Naasia lichenicola]|uniref:type IV toxin-antitoxin system AbiEi family antitoxin domain-containing protein n=1 Tax=Naasia lichenicola TaxID=2565933 RepID=UPI00130D8FFC|nr:type IV toxin-antitoxin system AbiEi family antitoxin domain-containing protein [Naasia lichenicola]
MNLDSLSRRGILLISDLRQAGMSPRTVQSQVSSGRLVHIRRGAYCDRTRWEAADLREQHRLRMRAVVESSPTEPVFCGESAAAAWRLPTMEIGDRVSICAQPADGGRSQGDVRRHPTELASTRIQEVDGFLVTGVARTACDLALANPFSDAVGTVDAALAERNVDRVTKDDLQAELHAIDPRYRKRNCSAVIEFATHLSDSYGESFARAQIHLLGFETPELQVPFSDERGAIGRVDFYWPGSRVIGEFDGAVKYMAAEMRNGLSPADIVWKEKKREDRLRRQSDALFRLIWADIRDRSRLRGILLGAGLTPRRGR